MNFKMVNARKVVVYVENHNKNCTYNVIISVCMKYNSWSYDSIGCYARVSRTSPNIHCLSCIWC